jgi:hypothetical protein
MAFLGISMTPKLKTITVEAHLWKRVLAFIIDMILIGYIVQPFQTIA